MRSLGAHEARRSFPGAACEKIVLCYAEPAGGNFHARLSMARCGFAPITDVSPKIEVALPERFEFPIENLPSELPCRWQRWTAGGVELAARSDSSLQVRCVIGSRRVERMIPPSGVVSPARDEPRLYPEARLSQKSCSCVQ
jgi:hypothetical protein